MSADGGRTQLDRPVTTLPGIGPSAAQKLARLGIETLADLLLHLPFRYQDRTRSIPTNELVAGRECLVTGQILEANVAYGRRRSLVVVVDDGSGRLTVRFFHFAPRQRDTMRPGVWMRCFGDVRPGPTGLEMVHPEYSLHGDEPPTAAESLTPIYHATQGLASTRIGTWIARALAHCEDVLLSRIEDPAFADLMAAIRYLHAPPATEQENIRKARSRVALDELIGHYLVLRQRQALLKAQTTWPLPPHRGLGRALLDRFGFRLTRAQARVTSEVLNDLAAERPMMRLLQGDVGSGKTVVAAFAAIRAAENGCQTAVMAPTEILAEQHFETLSAWLPPLGINVGLVTGRQTAVERRARLAAVNAGEDLVVVGTHALFQAGVEFHKLALAVIDEQHRFGVHQRMALRAKGCLPHQLVMTATPIPRTLTMALYADMDVSTIDELPPGRKPVRTRLAAMPRRAEVIERVGRMCALGRQAYWVCTLIEDDAEGGASDGPAEQEGAKTGDRPRPNAAEATFAELTAAMPSSLRLGLVHGRLPVAEKRAVMAAFKAAEIDLLVATTVIEVGVDVPNATLLVIDNAERLGLAQLHQLRGRVGRDSSQSECILLFEPPLSAVARQRLATMRATNDGFDVAEKDLELRGPGDILGTRQTGEQAFKVADLATDRALLSRAVTVGNQLLEEDQAMASLIVDTWARGEIDYATV